MFAALRSTWALFLGVGLIMTGAGLQNALLGVRATAEAFPTTAIGLVMSAFYLGFLGGSLLVPGIVQAVGHIRSFAALASLASTAVLVHVIFIDPVTWGLMRLITGFAFAGLYIVAESWLNDRATNETRGQLLSFYMMVGLIGMGGGQVLLNLASPEDFQLFILVSVLISLALIPILLTAAPVPSFEAPEKVSVMQLYRASPLGVVGCFGIGAAHGALLGMGAVYATSMGMSFVEVSAFMAAVYLGGALLQWPVGKISDRFDRRRVITAVTLLTTATALAALVAAQFSMLALFVLTALFGGLTLPMYSLSVSHTNDFLEPQQMVAASASLYLVTGVGAIMGPLGISWAMELLGPMGFFVFLAAIHLAIGVFAIWRMTRRAARPVEEQGHYAATWAPASSQYASVMAAEDTVAEMEEAAHADTHHGASQDGEMLSRPIDDPRALGATGSEPEEDGADLEPGGEDRVVA